MFSLVVLMSSSLPDFPVGVVGKIGGQSKGCGFGGLG